MDLGSIVRSAFPSQLTDDGPAIVRHLSVMPHGGDGSAFDVIVRGEAISIPERVYFHPETYRRDGLSDVQSDMIDCLHTRNSDGFVRETALRAISNLNAPWVVPYVVRLAGGHVVEILQAIHDRRSEIDCCAYRQFTEANPKFSAITQSRIVSYWNAYHRQRCPMRADYVGVRLMPYLGLA